MIIGASYPSARAQRLVLDVDGVVLDFYRGAFRVARECFGSHIRQVCNAPATKARFGLSDAQYQDLRTAMLTHPHGWANLPPLPGALEAIAALQAAEHEIIFLTSCGSRMRDQRRENMARLGLGDCELLCVEECANNKGRELMRLRPYAFVDDHVRMLVQAPFVPERVFIDHGCDLERDPLGCPVDLAPYTVVPSLAAWAQQHLARVASREATAPLPSRPRVRGG